MAKLNRSPSNMDKSDKSSHQSTISKTTRPSTNRSYLSELCNELEKAAHGLTHKSESDSPYCFFTLIQPSLPQDNSKLTILEFLSSIGLSQGLTDEFKTPVGGWIEERPFDGFFPSIQDIADYYGLAISNKKVVAESRRYQKLEKVLRKQLLDVKVFRVGKVDVRCYIAGYTKQGNIAGLVTTAIET